MAAPAPSRVQIGERSYEVEADPQTGRVRVREAIPAAQWIDVDCAPVAGGFVARVGSSVLDIIIDRQHGDSGIEMAVHTRGARGTIVVATDSTRSSTSGSSAGRRAPGQGNILAPMPGRIVNLFVGVGDTVEKNQRLLAIEAMKMENELRSPHAGVVEEVRTKAGDSVEARVVLMRIRAATI